VLFGLHTLWIIVGQRRQETRTIGNMGIHVPPPKHHVSGTVFDLSILPELINLPPFHQKIRSIYRECYRAEWFL
jgi:hypothetical protein